MDTEKPLCRQVSDAVSTSDTDDYQTVPTLLIAKTFPGLEPVLANELTALGASDIRPGIRVVSFKGTKELMYRANFSLRTAVRILLPIRFFRASNADEVYKEAYKTAWERYIQPGQTFAVDAVTYSEEFVNSRFVAYRVKDAVVDYFREKTGARPNISVTNPDIRLHIHISGTDATLALDSSGASLHQRGYRSESVEAPINEVLAAGIILLTGWKGEADFIDPMCGSGTFLVEAALIARGIAPGVFRKGYAFERWNDFDRGLFQRIYDDDSGEHDFPHHIYGYDIDPKAVAVSQANIKAAGLSKDITVGLKDFKDFDAPAEKAVIVTNPPYGERITTPNLPGTYRMIGERLKHAFQGNEAWILTFKNEDLIHQIGLKPSVKIPLFNGSLPCELLQYRMFDGKFKEFRADGGVIKTEREKEERREKPKPKKTNNYFRRQQERANNEDGDIRSFTFHSLEREREQRRKTGKDYGRSGFGRGKDRAADRKKESKEPFAARRFRSEQLVSERRKEFNKRKKIFSNDG
ncbi:MAG: THUMP domain-containing protein [Prevotella sp.]|nr:THUMP domain-containing protein [Prevotella sp.]